MNYSTISDFGPNVPQEVNNPLTYCMNNQIEQGFLHGPDAVNLGEHSRSCQIFMSEYAAQKWDAYAEKASQNTNQSFPNQMPGSCGCPLYVNGHRITQGQILIYNTAARKYIVHMHGGRVVSEMFDVNVPTSPMISYYVPADCHGTTNASYEVNPNIIDEDPVMDKLLMTPQIAPDILINIYNTMKRKGTLKNLQGTKLGKLYGIIPYFKSRGGLGLP